MITIRCSVYEKHDLLQAIEYAQKKKIEDYNNEKITYGLLKIELDRLDTLKQRIDGKYKEDYLQTSAKYIRDNPSYHRKDEELTKEQKDSKGKWR